MGIGGVSVGSLLIVLAIVVLLFGTKKLRTLGGDLGGAFRGFRDAVRDGESAAKEADKIEQQVTAESTAETVVPGEADKQQEQVKSGDRPAS